MPLTIKYFYLDEDSVSLRVLICVKEQYIADGPYLPLKAIEEYIKLNNEKWDPSAFCNLPFCFESRQLPANVAENDTIFVPVQRAAAVLEDIVNCDLEQFVKDIYGIYHTFKASPDAFAELPENDRPEQCLIEHVRSYDSEGKRKTGGKKKTKTAWERGDVVEFEFDGVTSHVSKEERKRCSGMLYRATFCDMVGDNSASVFFFSLKFTLPLNCLHKPRNGPSNKTGAFKQGDAVEAMMLPGEAWGIAKISALKDESTYTVQWNGTNHDVSAMLVRNVTIRSAEPWDPRIRLIVTAFGLKFYLYILAEKTVANLKAMVFENLDASKVSYRDKHMYLLSWHDCALPDAATIEQVGLTDERVLELTRFSPPPRKRQKV